MSQRVLKTNGQVVPQCSCEHLTPVEVASSNETKLKKWAGFDAEFKRLLGDSFTLSPEQVKKPHCETEDNTNTQDDDYEFEPYKDDEETPVTIPAADLVDATGRPIL